MNPFLRFYNYIGNMGAEEYAYLASRYWCACACAWFVTWLLMDQGIVIIFGLASIVVSFAFLAYGRHKTSQRLQQTQHAKVEPHGKTNHHRQGGG